MADLTDLTALEGSAPTVAQLQGIIAQIDLDVANLLRDGKLAAAKYGRGGGMPEMDRAANLQALLAARDHYQQLLNQQPVQFVSQGGDSGEPGSRSVRGVEGRTEGESTHDG